MDGIGFGPRLQSDDNVLDWLLQRYDQDMVPEEKFLRKMKSTFKYYDTGACERIANFISNDVAPWR